MLILTINLFGCKEDGNHSKNHPPSTVSVSHTIWTDKTELFVEFNALIAGKKNQFAAHFSEMKHFKAIKEGRVTVSLVRNKTGIRHQVDGPSSPGIFKPSLTPKEAGVYTLIFEITTPDLKDQIRIKNVEVFANVEEAKKKTKRKHENSNEISFLKEQAWKMEFANAPVVRGTVYDIIKTGGQILPSQGDVKTITASSSGIIMYTSNASIIGSNVIKGQSLFTITGGHLTKNNVETEYLKAKSIYKSAKTTFDRKSQLHKNKAISKSEYEKALLSFQLAERNYLSLASNFSGKGKVVKSSLSGYIKTLYKQEGEYIEAGEPLAVITQNKRLTILADVDQSEYPNLNDAITANFLFDGHVHTLEQYNGKLLSYGKNVSSVHPKIPVYFELDNTGDLLSGSFIEVWIKTKPKKSALIIPVSAIMEQYGAFSVYVQNSGESFEKRDLKLGLSDGIYIEVISGVKEGERVVTKGAYQVKMAAMSSQVPAHGHSH